MTDAEALALADKVDIWIVSGEEAGAMRTLREALGLCLGRGPSAKLFRPGGFGDQAVWIDAAQAARLHDQLMQAAA